MATDSTSSLLALRVSPPRTTRHLFGALALAVVVLLWWLFTWGGKPEGRVISSVLPPSPIEVAKSFPALCTERALLQSIAATLRRVLVGFGLAALVGIPLG